MNTPSAPSAARRIANVAKCLFESGDDAWPAFNSLNAQVTIERLLAQMSAAQRADLDKLLWLIEWVLPLGAGVLPPFSQRSADKQTRVLNAMMLSRLPQVRGAFDSLKALCCLVYFSHPATWPLIAYEGPQ